jgi:RHS repeat-associated protein
MPVVASLQTADGVGGVSTSTFRYEGMVINRERGSLGFKKVTIENDTAKSRTVTEFNQLFPYIGTVASSESYINDVKISDAYTIMEVSNHYDNQDILNIDVVQSAENKYDYNSGEKLLTSYTINSDIDKYGNIQTVQTTTEQGETTYTKVTQSLYENNEANWILARLTDAQVTHQHPNRSAETNPEPDVVKRSKFIYDLITGTLTTEIIEPDHEKALTKTYTYDTKGNKISEVISAAGITPRENKYLYDQQGKNVVKVTNALNQSVQQSYDIRNNVVSQTSANGLVTTYTYDEMGRKTEERRPDGTITRWSHTWDSSLPNAMYKVTVTTTGAPPSSTYYDTLSRTIRVEKIGFDGSTIYEDTYYNAQGKVERSTTPHYAIDAPEFIVKTYDALGRMTSIERPGPNGESIRDTIAYDGLTVRTTNAKEQVKEITSNIIGQKVEIREGSGDATSITNFAYDAMGNLKTTTDNVGNQVIITYDVFGHKTSMHDPDMGYWRYTYDTLGQLVSQTDAKGQITTMAYDLLGRLVKRIELGRDGTSNVETVWVYDRSDMGIGKLSYVYNDNYRKEFFYDSIGRIESTNEYMDQQIFTTSFSYNAEGKLHSTTRPDGFVTINEYNEHGFLSAVKSPKGGADSAYTYEEIKEAIEQSLQTSFEYAQTSIDYQNQADEKRAKGELFLALANQTDDEVLQAQLFSTASLSAETAALLETSAHDTAEESLKALKRVNYFLKEAQRFNDTEFYSFVADTFRDQTRFYIDLALTNLNNAIDRLDTLFANETLEPSYLDQEKALIESHINQSQTLILVAKSLSEKVLHYKTKHIASVNSAQTHQRSTYLDMVEDADYTYYYKILQADEFGRVTRDIVGNGLVTVRDYNRANGHLNTITTGYNGSNDIRDISYTYDALDNVKEIHDKHQGIESTYTYDNMNRVTWVNYKNLSQNTYLYKHLSNKQRILGLSFTLRYRYDTIGNITFKSDIGDYAYDRGAHQVTNAGGVDYDYDANGNVIQKGDLTITYSAFNKPIAFDDGTTTTEFFYAPNRARYKKTMNGDTTYYAGKLFEKEIKGEDVRYKNFIYAGSEVVAINIEEDDGTLLIPSIRYLHKDALGSVDTITNASGQVVQRVSYKPFGDRIVGSWHNESSEEAITKRGFTGHEHISEFNLIHMNGRVYDPTIGRFLSADPHIQAPYDTQSFNRYSYVKNNPLKYTDPSGFFFKKIFRAVSKVVKKVVKVVKKYWKQAVTIAVGVMVAIATGGAAIAAYGQFWGAVIAGAAAGAASGVVGTKLNGGSWSQALRSGLKGAVIGGVSAGMAYGVAEATAGMFNVGSDVAHASSFLEGGSVGMAAVKAVMHGVSRAAMAKVQGNKTSSAFWSGFVSSAFAAPKGMGREMGTAVTALASGTTSAISGGKFANGAVTGAFVHLFNSWGNYRDPMKVALGYKGPPRTIAEKAVSNAITRGTQGALIGLAKGGPARSLAGFVVGVKEGIVETMVKESSLQETMKRVDKVNAVKVLVKENNDHL